MATVVHRTAVPILILYSVNTPDYPEEIWIINPDLTILETVPIHYIKIVGDLLVEMTTEEKAVVDAAELAEYKTNIIRHCCSAREAKIEYGTGAEYPEASGKYISTTDKDQGRWLYWESIGGKWASLGLSYPFRVHSRDGSTYVDITRSQDFTAVVEVIGVYVTGLFSEAEVVIQNVLSATTIEEVDNASSAYIASAPQIENFITE